MLSLDDISISYKKNKELEKFKEKKPIETLKPGTVDRMREVLKTQGIDEKEIEEHIEKFARRNREIELKSIKR